MDVGDKSNGIGKCKFNQKAKNGVYKKILYQDGNIVNHYDYFRLIT